MKRTFLLISIILIFTLTSCVTDYTLLSSDKTENKVFFEEGNEYQVAETSSLKVKAAGLETVNGANAVLVNIENKTNDDYSFKDSQIKIYGGTAGRLNWDFIGTWNAASYLSELVEDAAETKRAVRLLGTAAVIDSIFNPNTELYDPLDVLLTVSFTDMIDRDISKELSHDIKLAKSTMLFSSAISPDKQYSGIFYFPADKTYPDYKIVFSEGSDKLQFLFAKSNREEIIHPWTADRKRDLLAITFMYAFAEDKVGGDLLWLEPKSFGLYTGLNGYIKEELVSYDIGLTYKLCNHTWLLAGCEMGGHEGEEYDDSFFARPEVGVNFSYNWLDFEFKASYDFIGNKLQAGAGAGFSF